MKELVYHGKGTLGWRDAQAPVLRDTTDALVRPVAVARCDLETAFFRHNLSPLLRAGVAAHLLDPRLLEDFGPRPFRGPFPVGHECVAEIVSAGPDVAERKVGDLVVVPYQVSCGICLRCGEGNTAHCSTDRPSSISAFGGFADPHRAWGAALSDLIRIPFADHMLVPLPVGLDPVAYASAGDNLVDAYRAVRPVSGEGGEAPVLVAGGSARSIGLYAVACARAQGSAEVVYVDTNRERLEIAQALGARVIEARFQSLTRSRTLAGRFPVTVEASGRRSGMALALQALEVCGSCRIVGFHWRRGTPLPLWDIYARGLSVESGMVNARALLPDLLQLAVTGRLHAERVISRTAAWGDAPQALIEDCTKVVVARPRL